MYLTPKYNSILDTIYLSAQAEFSVLKIVNEAKTIHLRTSSRPSYNS